MGVGVGVEGARGGRPGQRRVAARLEHLKLAGEDARLRHVPKGRGAEVGLHTQEAGPEIRLERETARLWELVHLLVGLERAQRERIHLPRGSEAQAMSTAQFGASRRWRLGRITRRWLGGGADKEQPARACPAHQKTFQSVSGGSVLWKPWSRRITWRMLELWAFFELLK